MRNKNDVYNEAIKRYIVKYSRPEISFEEADEGGIKYILILID